MILKSIRTLTIRDILNGKTLPVRPLDTCLSSNIDINKTVKTKEDLGITDCNLVLKSDKISNQTIDGQLFIHNGRVATINKNKGKSNP